jgi:hypothetical protein
LGFEPDFLGDFFLLGTDLLHERFVDVDRHLHGIQPIRQQCASYGTHPAYRT